MELIVVFHKRLSIRIKYYNGLNVHVKGVSNIILIYFSKHFQRKRLCIWHKIKPGAKTIVYLYVFYMAT